MAVGIIKTRHYSLTLAVNHPRLSPHNQPQFLTGGHQQNPIAPYSYQLSRGLERVHRYHAGVLENKVGSLHFDQLN